MSLPEILENAVHSMSKLPGIGSKTAMRHVLKMSQWDREILNVFCDSIKKIADLKKCQKCRAISDDDICAICTDENRNSSKIICVVENYTDLLAIENARMSSGVYHVLGGVLNPLIGIGPEALGLFDLVKRVQEEGITELILAINPSVEGDSTCSFIKDLIGEGVKVERIGFGVPVGGSIELLDSMTISKAFENRRMF